MLARWLRKWERGMLKPVLIRIGRSGIGPNAVTLAGLAAAIVSGFVLSTGHFGSGACLVLLGGLLDAVDGELARILGRETPFGAFLDSVSDHCGDFTVYLGLLWFFLTGAANTEVLLIFVASFGSVFGSQVRSRAAMWGIETKDVGLFTRFERVLVLALGLLSGQVTAALWVLAVFNNVTAVQRVYYTVHAARMPGLGSGAGRPL
jgi:CDP-diacylglycerol---glycerol-3-phosphate 3-phosphatidyltransferase